MPRDQCGYAGPRWSPDTTFEKIPDVNFNGSYGNGQNINVPFGNSKLIFGGLTIPEQEISPATYASVGNNPQGPVSGLLGLSYPGVTTSYPGNDPAKDIICDSNAQNSTCGPTPYSPFITVLFSQNSTSTMFAFALSRSTVSGELMTIGGIPDLQDPYINATTGVSVTVPILTDANATGQYIHYKIGVDGVQYSGAKPGAGQGQYFVDTGTSITTLPAADTKAFNGLFDPPAMFNQTLKTYTVLCNATAPEPGLSIGGQIFQHNPRDLIILMPGSDGICFSAVQAGLATVVFTILGAQFLKNVLAVFDLGKTEMTFMSRMDYLDA